MYEITFNYDESVMRRAAMANLKKHGPRLMTVFGVSVIVSLLLRNLSLDLFGLNSIFIGAFIGLAILSLLLPLLIYAVSVHNSKRLLKKLSDPAVALRFDEDAFHFSSDISDSTIKWKAFQKVYQGNDVWLLFLDAGRYFPVPVELMDDALSEFVLQKLRDNQVKLCDSIFSV